MLDPDISARDALALLRVRDDDPAGLSRRRFLQMVGLGVGGGMALGSFGNGLFRFPGEMRDAQAAPLAANQGVLVLVGMYGGNDGLNTVVPYADPHYMKYRSNIGIPTNQLLTIDSNVGLHPSLPYIKSLYDGGQVAILQGVGYPDPSLSHFDSMAIWMNGSGTGADPNTGWIGRWLDANGGAGPFAACVIGSDVPLHMIGATTSAIGVPEWGFSFGGGTSDDDLRLYDAVRALSATSAGRGPWHDTLALAEKSYLDVTKTISPVFTPDPPDGALLKSMTIAARLINADIGLRVIDASMDNFDTHSGEPTDHQTRMDEFNAGIQGFYATLDPKFRQQVTIMTYSEFGRTPWSNDSLGTDHGTANNHFVIGGNVKGGLYGAQPALMNSDGSDLDEWDRVDFNVDFRSMYATMLEGLLGAGSSSVLQGSFSTIDLFRGPLGNPVTGGGGGGGGVNVTTGADFVSLTPARLLDTRDNAGAPIGPASKITLQVTGAGGVAAGAVAAVLNVTAVNGTAPSYLTVWPTGADQPNTSSLNMVGGDVVPNLCITKLSDAGQVDIYNNGGNVHCVVDVVGFFTTASAARYSPLTPARVLDTRNGTGAPIAAVGQDAWIDVQIAGMSGVAADADSVVMNVTVTAPTAPGYVTVWPTGQDRPKASNLNFVANQTVPNLVIAKLGAGGKVSMYNSAGGTHMIADVLGYFKAGTGAGLVPLVPARLLDTRTDGGASKPVDQTPIMVMAVGRGGVPSTGVTAVVINLTATGGTRSSYVTAYPHGEGAPLASNLNLLAGDTRANLVIAKVGADGAVALFNSDGHVHLIADVVGYFTG